MGVQVNALDDPESELVQAFHEYVWYNFAYNFVLMKFYVFIVQAM